MGVSSSKNGTGVKRDNVYHQLKQSFKQETDTTKNSDAELIVLSEVPSEVVMIVISFLDKRTKNFGVSLACKQLFVLSKLCNHRFQISPLAPSLFRIENESANSDVSLDAMVNDLTNSEWTQWFHSLSFEISKTARDVIRYTAVSAKDVQSNTQNKLSKYQFKDTLNNSQLELVLRKCRALKSINISNCSEINDYVMQSLGSYAGLQELNLFGTSVTNIGFNRFALCKPEHLKRLAVSTMVGFNNIIQVLKHCRLETLKLYSHPTTLSADESFFKEVPETTFPTVSRFTYSDWNQLERLELIGQLFPNLTSVGFHNPRFSSAYEQVYIVSFSELIASLPNTITKFSMKYPCFHQISFGAICEQFPWLSKFKLDPDCYSQFMFQDSPLACHTLSQLNAIHFNSPMLYVMDGPIASNCFSLRKLAISNSSMRTVSKILTNNPMLTSLTLFNPDIRENDLEEIKNALSGLQLLTVLNLGRISTRQKETFEFVSWLANSDLSRRLTVLEITQCRAFTAAAADALFLSLSKWTMLSRLDLRGSLSTLEDDEVLHVQKIVHIIEEHAPFVLVHSLK